MAQSVQKQRRPGRVLLLVLILLLVVALALGLWWGSQRPSGQQSFLLLGYDGWGKIEPGQGRTDTILLVTMDYDQNRWMLTSFLRDSIATTPAGKQTKLNTLAQRGEDVLVDYLQDTYGIPIDGVMSTNFTGIVLLVDSIGGITVELDSSEVSYLKKHAGQYDGYPLVAGQCRLNGAQTLEYMRIRALDSDIGRTGRQGKALSAVKARAGEIGLTEALSLLNNVQDLYHTQMSLGDQATLVRNAYRLRNAPMEQITIPQVGSYSYGELNGTSVVRFNTETSRQALREFLGLPQEEQ